MKIYYVIPLYLALVAVLTLGVQYSVAGVFARELPFLPTHVGLHVLGLVVLLVIIASRLHLRSR